MGGGCVPRGQPAARAEALAYGHRSVERRGKKAA